MTQRMENLIQKMAELPDDKQNSFAAFMIAELESELRWDQLFASSASSLGKMAADALAEYDRGETISLDLKRDFPNN